jgi:hypothetical protein
MELSSAHGVAGGRRALWVMQVYCAAARGLSVALC